MPIDVRMPDGTLVRDVPDNITQADLMARFNAFQAQSATPVESITPQTPTGPEGAPIPPVLKAPEPKPLNWAGTGPQQTPGEYFGSGDVGTFIRGVLSSDEGDVAKAKNAVINQYGEDILKDPNAFSKAFHEEYSALKERNVETAKAKEAEPTPGIVENLAAFGKQALEHPVDTGKTMLYEIGKDPLYWINPASGAADMVKVAKEVATLGQKALEVTKGTAGAAAIGAAGNVARQTGEIGLGERTELNPQEIANQAANFASLHAAADVAGKVIKAGTEKLKQEKALPKPIVEVGQPTITPSPEITEYDKEIAKTPVTPEEQAEPIKEAPSSESHDAQAMLDELTHGKEIPLDESQFEEEVKPTEITKKPISNAKDLVKDLGGESAQQLRDDFNPTYNYTNKDGVEVTFKEEGKVFNLVPGDENTQVGSDIHLDYIGSKDRNKGLASKELDRIINKADENNLSISLEVDKQDKDGLTNDQLKDWYGRKGFVFPRGSDIGYRPRPDEALTGYPEKTIQVPSSKIQDVEQQINSDLTGRTFSDEETFYEVFNSGNLKEGYQMVPTDLGDEIYYYDGKNKPTRVDGLLGNYDTQSNKVLINQSKLLAEPTGIISETEKEFTPVGGRLITAADAEKLGAESKKALEQNLIEQEAARDKQLRREIREEKFPAAKTPSLATKLKKLGGINQANKLDMFGDTGKIFNYESAFSKDGEDLLTHIENGDLDEYLPYQLRLSNTPPNEAFDPRPGYDYLSKIIESRQKVHDYDYELAKIEHENMIKENRLAKQYMEPNEAARAAAAEVQGKEYMNIAPEEAKFHEEAKNYVSEAPAYYFEDQTPSFKIEMNKLRRAIKKGKVTPEEVIPAIEDIYASTKKEKPIVDRQRGAAIIKEKLLAAKRRKELSPEMVDMAEWFINQNPDLVKDLAVSIRSNNRDGVAGGYLPISKLAKIFKYSPSKVTAVHEILHHTERMMPKDMQEAIRAAWSKSLQRDAERAFGGKNEALKQYYRDVIDFHYKGDREAEARAMKMLADNVIGHDHYKNFNPSEFWAVKGSDIVQNRFKADISESMVAKIKNWLKEFIEKVKGIFKLSDDAPVIKALDSIAKSDGKFITDDMIHAGEEYAAVSPPKNIKGQEVQPSWHGPDESKIDLWLYRLQNKQIDTKRVQEAIKDIDDHWNVYEKEQLYHGRTATGIREFLLKELLPAIKDIDKFKIDTNEIRKYLHNRHAEERNIQMNKINPDIYDPKTNKTIPNPLKDKGSGIETKDARKYLADLEPEKKRILEDIAKKFDEMIKGTQDILVKSGAETKETIDKWNKTYEHYVPLFRVEDDLGKPTGLSGVGQGFGTRGAFSKRALGSEKEVQDILSNIIAQRERALIRAEKIRVGRALYGLSIQNPNPDFWLPINPDAIRSRKKAIAELSRMGIPDAKDVVNNLMAEPKERYLQKVREAEGTEPEEDFDFDSGLPVNQSKEVVASKVNVMARYKDFVFPVRVNGKDRYVFFNKNDPRALRMVQALKNLDVEELGFIENLAGKFTRWFKNVNTQYNPVFGFVNLIRDYQGALFNLSSTEIKGKQAQVSAGIFPAMRGILNVHRAERKGIEPAKGKWADIYQDARREGFQTGYRDSLIRNQEEMQLIEHTLNQFKDSNARKAFQYVVGALTDFNDMMENAIRLSAYKVALDKGLSKQKAAIIAKNLTVNFDKKGAWTSEVNALYAFFNASVQGTERIYQTLKGPAGKMIIGGGIGAGVIQAIILASAGYGKNDPPEFVREKNFIVPTGDGQYLTIPYPLGFNILPNVGRISTDFILHGGQRPGEHVANLTGTIMDSLSPLGSTGWSMQTLAPTALDPLAALAENKDAFGRPISRPDRATNPTPGYTRSRDTASELGQGIAYYLNLASNGSKYQKGFISPTADEVDFLAGQLGGGLYRETAKAVKAAASPWTGEEIPSYRIPIGGRFYGETGSQAAIAQTFYENVTRMADHENEIKGRRKNKEEVNSYFKDHPEARLWNVANTIENEINAINKTKRMLIEKKAPVERIKAIDTKKARIMKNFNDRVAKLNPD